MYILYIKIKTIVLFFGHILDAYLRNEKYSTDVILWLCGPK